MTRKVPSHTPYQHLAPSTLFGDGQSYFARKLSHARRHLGNPMTTLPPRQPKQRAPVTAGCEVLYDGLRHTVHAVYPDGRVQLSGAMHPVPKLLVTVKE